MIIRNEVFQNGVCVSADVYNLDNKMYTFEQDGQIVTSRPMTTDEWIDYGPQPLDHAGALATLLVVEGVLPIDDAANAVGQTPDALVVEAESWAVASSEANI